MNIQMSKTQAPCKNINNLNDGFEIENGRVRNQIFLNGW